MTARPGLYLVRRLVYILLTVGGPVLSPASSPPDGPGGVKGKVIDRATGAALPFANIVIKGSTLGTSAKPDGTFLIPRVPAGKRHVNAGIVGYTREEKEVTIEAGKTIELTFALDELPVTDNEVVVSGDLPISAASSKSISAIDFALRPRTSSQDLLRLVPGLFIAQHAGGGKAEQIFLRGFDCDHGTDVNVSVDGIPVNMVSHGHGQGYADLHFVMPEVLKGMEVYKGPYFAQFGDFGTAGTVKFNTLDEVDQSSLSVEGGNFGMLRAVSLVRLPLESDATTAYVAGEALHNDSYFDNKQNFKRYNLFGKLKSRFNENQSFSVWASSFSSRWNASGQIPERAVAEGLIDRFGSIDPSEGGETSRQNVNLLYMSVGTMSQFLAQTFFTSYHFQLFSNFTFFKNDPINGDEIEQDDDRNIAGGRAEYNLMKTFGSPDIHTLIGATVRTDRISNQLWHVAKRVRLSDNASADILQTNLSFYVQQDYVLSRYFRLQFGLRNDQFFFNVKDRVHQGMPGDITGKVTQNQFSPKVNLTFSPLQKVDIFLNYGIGFHSNDARGVLAGVDGVTLPRATGAEVGTRFSSTRFTASISLWGLDLQHELVYSGDEGTTEVTGATRRIGIDFGTRAQLLDWLWADMDLAVARGRYRDLPEGENYIALAPSVASTGGLTARHESGIEGSLRYRMMNDRPANEDNSIRAKGYFIVDAGIAYPFSTYKLTLTAENVLNTPWNEAQFATDSMLRGEQQPVWGLHFTPGAPISLRVKVDYLF